MKFKSIQFSVAALAGAIVLNIVAALVLYAVYAGARTQALVQQRTQQQFEAFLSGDHAEALRRHTSLLPAFDAVMGVPNYGATTAKAALQLLGVLDNRNVRGPLAELDDDEHAALEAALRAADLL